VGDVIFFNRVNFFLVCALRHILFRPFFLLSEVGPWCIWFLSWTFGLSMTVGVECEGTTFGQRGHHEKRTIKDSTSFDFFFDRLSIFFFQSKTCRETFTGCSDQILYLLISLLRNTKVSIEKTLISSSLRCCATSERLVTCVLHVSGVVRLAVLLN
jgi:hypothetical protein